MFIIIYNHNDHFVFLSEPFPSTPANGKSSTKECSDLIQKQEQQSKVLKLFHAAVKQRQNSDGFYSDAKARVAGEVQVQCLNATFRLLALSLILTEA